MSTGGRKIRAWLPAALGILSVVGAGAFATLRQSRAADDIARLDGVGSELSKAAAHVQSAAMSPGAGRVIRARREVLTTRMQDAMKPGLYQAELVKAARDIGLSVREIRPEGQRHASPGEVRQDYPAYRVSVFGSYRHIAEFMESCKTLRLPARVRTFRVSAPTGQEQRSDQLSADITLEAFQPDRPISAGGGA
jgi:hypothetical protein